MNVNQKYKLIISEVMESERLDPRKRFFRNSLEEMNTEQIATFLTDAYSPKLGGNFNDVNLFHISGNFTTPLSSLPLGSVKAVNERSIAIRTSKNEQIIDLTDKVIGVRRGFDLKRNYVDFVYITDSVSMFDYQLLKQQGKSVPTNFIGPLYSCTEEGVHYMMQYYIDYEPALREYLSMLEDFENRN